MKYIMIDDDLLFNFIKSIYLSKEYVFFIIFWIGNVKCMFVIKLFLI